MTYHFSSNLIAVKRNDLMSVANMGRPQADELNCLRTSGSMTIYFVMRTESLNRENMISQFFSTLMRLIAEPERRWYFMIVFPL